MNVDAVAVAAFVLVGLCVVLVGFIGVKVKSLMQKDAEANKRN